MLPLHAFIDGEECKRVRVYASTERVWLREPRSAHIPSVARKLFEMALNYTGVRLPQSNYAFF